MMKRIVLLLSISVLATLILGWVNLAEAQKAGNKVYRIGILRSGSQSFYVSRHRVLRQRLRELGYSEGKNLLIEYRYAESKFGRLSDLAAELVRLKVDVLVVSPSPLTILAAQEATQTIPIVMMGFVLDPVKEELVASLRRPGGNITGLINLRWGLDPKRLELIKEAFPRISRVAILWPEEQQEQWMEKIEATAQALGVQMQSVNVSGDFDLDKIEDIFFAISLVRADALLVPSMRTTLRHRARIIDFAATRRLPTIYANRRFVDAGGLMSYDASSQEMLRQVATYVDKILKGANPAELPIEQPRKFDLIINLKTAKQLDVTIPPEVLYQATKVIK